MKARTFSLTQWFDQRVKRERIILLVCAVVVIVFLLNLLVLESISQKRRMVTKSVSDLRSELDNLILEEAIIVERRANDPDNKNRLRIAVLETELTQLRQQLEGNIVNLVAPADMPELLKSLLTQQKKLKLENLKNLSPELVDLNLPTDENVVVPNLYRHRLDLEFSGDYLTILKYLHQLEQFPRALAWEEITIETDKYPQVKVRMQVFTLSLSEGWIGG